MASPKGTERPFHGGRLRVARQLQGHTRGALSNLTGIPSAKLGRLESDRVPPSAQERQQLASALDVEPSFFEAPLTTNLDEESTHFRARVTTQRERDTPMAQAVLLGHVLEFLRVHLDLPKCSVPDLAGWSAEAAADSCRKAWGLSLERPIDNILRLAERAGAVVAHGALGSLEKVDAFSARLHDGGALIILNPADPPSRSAFNVAHELGHLALHRDREIGDKATEQEADAFASALLMPRAGFTIAWAEGPGTLELDWLIEMKTWWRVSLAAMVRRARDLRLITEGTYRDFFVELSKRGWRKNEPAEFVWPPAEFLRKCFSAMERYHSLPSAWVAKALGFTPSLLARVTGIDEINNATSFPENVVSLAAMRRRAL